jgi:hypothetical protein
MAATRADLRQFRQAGDLDPPALVVGQVQVQAVQLVGGHLVEDRQDLGLGMEVAGHVDVQAPKVEARRVVDGQQRDRALGIDQLGQRRQAVGRAFGIGGQDLDGPGLDRQPIAAGRQLLGGSQLDPQRNAAGGLARPGLGQMGQSGLQARARNAGQRHLQAARQVQAAAARIQPGAQGRGQDGGVGHRLEGRSGGGVDRVESGGGGPDRRVGRRAAGQPGLVGEGRDEGQALQAGLGIDPWPGAGHRPRFEALGRHIVVGHRVELGELMAFQLEGDADRPSGRQAGEGRRRGQAIEVAVDVAQGEVVAVGPQDRGDAAEVQRPAGGRGLGRGQGQFGQVARRGRRADSGTGTVVEDLVADLQRGGEAVELGLGRLGVGGGGRQQRQNSERDQAS